MDADRSDFECENGQLPLFLVGDRFRGAHCVVCIDPSVADETANGVALAPRFLGSYSRSDACFGISLMVTSTDKRISRVLFEEPGG